jgi:CRP-like cAMP-binding protein
MSTLRDPQKSRIERELFVRAFLATSPPARVAAQLSRAMRDTVLDPGQLLYRELDRAGSMHFVVSGRLRMERGGGLPQDLGPGAMVGLLDATIPRPHSHSAVALEATRLLTLDVADYLDILEDNFGFAVDTLSAGAREQSGLALRLGAEGAYSASTTGPKAAAALTLAKLDWVECLLLLRCSCLFEIAPVQALARLARSALVQEWDAKSRIIAPGLPVTQLHFVARGQVEVRQPEPGFAVEFGAGGLIAGLSALGAAEYTCEATAISDATTLGIAIEDLFDVAEDHFELCASMLSCISSERARVDEAFEGRGLALDVVRSSS